MERSNELNNKPPHLRPIIEHAIQTQVRITGSQTTAVSALFVPAFRSATAPAIHYPVPQTLQESAKNIAEYIDWNLTPAKTVQGHIQHHRNGTQTTP